MGKQKLIIICGSPCVGKSAAADLLFQMYDNSAYLDGDWCWCVNPFSVEDPRLREGDKAMSAVLSNYLRLGFDYVVFGSVVVMYENIRTSILKGITEEGYQVIGFTLTCSEETLRQRHKKRGDENECSMEWLHLPPYPGDYVIHTDGKTPKEVALEMKRIINSREEPARKPVLSINTPDLLLRTVTPADLPEIARMWDFENGAIPLSKAEKIRVRMEANHARNRPGQIYHLCLAVTERAVPGRIIGWCGLDGILENKLHIFYSIDPAYRGRGYATQAARALLDYAFREARVPFVNGGCDKDNLASYRVMKKAGMQSAGEEENGDPLFYIDRETYLNDIEIAGAAGLQDLPG